MADGIEITKESTQQQDIEKASLTEKLHGGEGSAAQRYQAFFVGRRGLGSLIAYELVMGLFALMTGALGYALRKFGYPRLCQRVGRGVLWGRNVTLRHPGKMVIGERTAVDDNCLLDAKGADDEGFRIGDAVMIARDTLIQAKTGGIWIGDRCVIGSQCQLSSAGGIRLGRAVMLAGQCYIGGGRYHLQDRETPMMDQGLYTKGPVEIEDDVWIGAGVVIQDGVRIGRGSVIGAGAVVREDVPPYTMLVPHQKHILLPRGEGA